MKLAELVCTQRARRRCPLHPDERIDTCFTTIVVRMNYSAPFGMEAVGLKIAVSGVRFSALAPNSQQNADNADRRDLAPMHCGNAASRGGVLLSVSGSFLAVRPSCAPRAADHTARQTATLTKSLTAVTRV